MQGLVEQITIEKKTSGKNKTGGLFYMVAVKFGLIDGNWLHERVFL
jgi:hypothetical protein